jgi:hypothetical protein
MSIVFAMGMQMNGLQVPLLEIHRLGDGPPIMSSPASHPLAGVPVEALLDYLDPEQ